MGKPDVAVVGLGPAGSLMAWKAAEAGYSVRAYDFQKSYTKPCGDAVIVKDEYEDLLRKSESIDGIVTRHIIEVSGYGSRIIEHGSPAWYIVDKTRLVGYFREQALSHGAEIAYGTMDPNVELGNVVVDARGPYAHLADKDSYIMTYRVFVKVDSWDSDTALLYFETEKSGLAWIFPSYRGENIVNAGGGLKGESLSRVKDYVKNFLKKRFGNGFEIIEEKAAPIAVYSEVEPVSNGIIRIGEAGGLINSAGGEGIRMALISALHASNSLSYEDPVKAYLRLVKPLVKESLLTRRLLRSVERVEARQASRLLFNLPEVFWREFLRGNMSYLLLFRSFIVKPRVGFEALRVLLSSRS